MQETPPLRGDNLTQERQSDLPSVQEYPEGEGMTRGPDRLTIVALLLMTPFILGIILTLLGAVK